MTSSDAGETPGEADPAPDRPALRVVRLLQFPVDVWGRGRRHSDELQREFALMSNSAAAPADTRSRVPRRLLEVIGAIRQQYSAGASPQDEQLNTALDGGVDVLDELVYAVPEQAAQASRQLLEIFDEADAFCREGKHLLTLATPDALVLFRRWFLGEFIRQLPGEPPLPWPEYLGQQRG